MRRQFLSNPQEMNVMFDGYSTANIGRYLRQIRRFPLLEAEEECVSARSWRENADGRALHKLLTSHLRLVVSIAHTYRGYGLPLSDLISEGNIGLIQAGHRFDPEKGFRFSTYAIWWIKAAIRDYILRSWSLVKIGKTRSQRTLFFKLRQMKNRVAADRDGDMTPDLVKLIAGHLGVKEHEVVYMNQRLERDMSLNATAQEEDRTGEWQDRLPDETPDQERVLAENDEHEYRRKTLRDALRTLRDRERYVFELRQLAENPIPMEALASELGISRERVRQIEARAFEKICRAVRSVQLRTVVADQQVGAMGRRPTP
ncbi:RNA polymerase sigma-32 factor [Bradyrhizobium erythrophlei]|uniref:RNA polymerase sigma-32 factor n=2 Tax=Bradyrhizobium erythrophlei TaxID=1437360 RepID=A0A1M5L3Y4_9BRAD|nr:RNA polymerase sigma-32 factor [Bradyrhizobium erythrophlei]